ncbi:hypothetical protein CVT25_004325 [Psilocybe cyanescens]|uniref:Epoxide hydrolase N-terminal domain-containing protein n=1 Tax=Psilocybe cyanescens TaxID=93625 RepID=A0A409XQ46_PSICY|nr:hypothetical protein CVT25_004325 [Psilocybe cyanescens]
MSTNAVPDTIITPFKINIPDERIEFLHKKLALTTLPDELEDAGRDYGVPLADVQRLVTRWKSGYDWRKHEKVLNDELPQFLTDIDVDGHGTLKIHFVHKKSEVGGAIPLLFVHGWPGSVIEVRKILPLLTQGSPDQPAFHVVALGLPGYGFSEAPKKRGFGFSQYAEVGNKLMLSLGYEQYVTQGGDWGYIVTQRIASLYGGKHSKAWHTNYEGAEPGRAPPNLLSQPRAYLKNLLTSYTPFEKAGLERTAWFQTQGMGYFMEQSTQPQTIGYNLADSPVGLLAWIYEKLVNWTDEYPWEDDEVLTWVSIYWFSTAGPAASARIYYEYMKEKPVASPTIPHGASIFPKDIYVVPLSAIIAMSSNAVPDASITPFKINIPDERIEFLHKKLALTTLPDELEDAGRDYGVPLADVQRLVARWKSGYNWRKYEKELNDELPQFLTDIDVVGHGTLKIHFVHKKSEVAGAIPLLFVHGWPGSFIEVRKILPLLNQGSKDRPAFHIVALGLPGFGFSEAPKKKGFAFIQYAEIGNKLMLSLGYEQYVTQGGDLGYTVTKTIASLYGGKHSKSWHTNYEAALPGQAPPELLSQPRAYLRNLVTKYTPAEKAGLAKTAWFRKEGMGYFMEQTTQPQTLGYSLADSPVGLLAWIYEKLVNWTDNYPWEDDEVLTWVSIYWFSTAGPTASTRIYYERTKQKITAPPTIPHGVSFFPQELFNVPRFWTRTRYRVFEAEHDSGGHFAAHEKPDELVEDLRKMFGRGSPAYGVVEGKPGY